MVCYIFQWLLLLSKWTLRSIRYHFHLSGVVRLLDLVPIPVSSAHNMPRSMYRTCVTTPDICTSVPQDLQKSVPGQKLNLWRVIWLTHRGRLLLGGFLKLCGDLVGFVAPLALKNIIDFVASQQELRSSPREFLEQDGVSTAAPVCPPVPVPLRQRLQRQRIGAVTLIIIT